MTKWISDSWPRKPLSRRFKEKYFSFFGKRIFSTNNSISTNNQFNKIYKIILYLYYSSLFWIFNAFPRVSCTGNNGDTNEVTQLKWHKRTVPICFARSLFCWLYYSVLDNTVLMKKGLSWICILFFTSFCSLLSLLSCHIPKNVGKPRKNEKICY